MNDRQIIAEVMDARSVNRTLGRLAHEIIERNQGAGNLVLIGLHTRGVPLAHRLAAEIERIEKIKVPIGSLDVTLYRDDLRQRPDPLSLQSTHIQFDIDGKVVVLVDDVLYTGRTIRSALDAVVDLGRPARIELAVMVDRGHRELPIKADYIGKVLPTSLGEEVAVNLTNIDGKDAVFLVVTKPDSKNP